MCRHLSSIARLAIAIAWLTHGGIGVADEDESQVGDRFLKTERFRTNRIFQNLQQAGATGIDNSKSDADNAVRIRNMFELLQQAGSGEGVTVNAANAILGGKLDPKKLRSAAALMPPDGKNKAVLKNNSDLRKVEPNIENVFRPLPPAVRQQQETQVENTRQRVTEQKTETRESNQRNGPPSICK
jgi:hypothetical protein